MSAKKGVCPECKQLVSCGELVFDPGSGVTALREEKEEQFYLCLTHLPSNGARVSHTVEVPSGKIRESFCNGSLRPPLEVVTIH